MDTHNNPKYLGSGTLILKAVKKYGRKNFKKCILEYCSSIEELEKRETWWINYFDALKNEDFYNLEDNRKRGINPFANKTPEELKVISNKIRSEERNKKIGDANRNKPKPKGFGEKMSKIHQGVKRSEYSKSKQSKALQGRESPNEKSCVVYNKKGKFIGEYKSRIECAKLLNLNPTQISKVIQGHLKTTGGYIIKNKTN